MRIILLVAVFSILAIVPLLHPGEFYDSREKLAPLFRLAELDKCVREGYSQCGGFHIPMAVEEAWSA
ncbi:MAG: hypothetical protein V3T58_03860 [Candidatus Hydrothermarchaeales archaeon]